MFSVDLPPERSSATEARRLVRAEFSDRLPERDVENLALVATELVSNAVLHARTALQLVVEQRVDRVHIEVSDHSAKKPTLRDAPPSAPDGRGLQIVDALTEAWGTESTGSGKRVWCDVRTGVDQRTAEHR